jgi:hypothetical protein
MRHLPVSLLPKSGRSLSSLLAAEFVLCAFACGAIPRPLASAPRAQEVQEKPLSSGELASLCSRLGAPEPSRREEARRLLADRLRPSDRAAVLARWMELLPDEVAARSGWRTVLRARPELLSWIHEGWLEHGSIAAREWVAESAVEAIRGSTQVGEDRRPAITCFPPSRWRIEPGQSLWDIVRDLDQLAAARLPLALDPRMGSAALAPLEFPFLAAGERPDEILTAAALARDAVIDVQGGCLWIGRRPPLPGPSAPDLAESLLSSAEAGNELERRLAFAALAAIGLPGWHDRCEERALSGGLTPELAAALLGVGPRGLERPLDELALALYAEPPPALGVSPRLAFRALWRRCLQAPLAPAVEARLLERAGSAEPRWRTLARFAAWRDPEAQRSVLQRFAETDDADGCVFAWRCLGRIGGARDFAQLRRALRRFPEDERLRGLLLQALEAGGLPAREDREDLRAARELVAELPELARILGASGQHSKDCSCERLARGASAPRSCACSSPTHDSIPRERSAPDRELWCSGLWRICARETPRRATPPPPSRARWAGSS